MKPDNVIPLFPERLGTIHVWPADEDGRFAIGQESASGGSWGWFSDYATAGEAVTAAYALRDQLYRECGGPRCNLDIPAAVLALLAEDDHAA